MNTLRRIFGLAALLVGSLWLGQGLGLVRWPASSFMVDQSLWAILGGVLTAIGLFLLIRSRRV